MAEDLTPSCWNTDPDLHAQLQSVSVTENGQTIHRWRAIGKTIAGGPTPAEHPSAALGGLEEHHLPSTPSEETPPTVVTKGEDMNRRTQGFTLIELLVVIAIIGVLAALLLPSYRNSTKRPNDVAALACGRAIVTFENANKIENSAYIPEVVNMGADVKEACTDQGVKVALDATTITGPSVAATNVVSTASDNYAFKIFHPEGTGWYAYNYKDGTTASGSRLNKLTRW